MPTFFIFITMGERHFFGLILCVLFAFSCRISCIAQGVNYWKDNGYTVSELKKGEITETKANGKKKIIGSISYYDIKDKHYKRGILNSEGDLIIPVIYSYVYFHGQDGGYFQADSHNRIGIYSKEGDILLPVKYNWVHVIKKSSGEKVFYVKIGSHAGIISFSGKEIIRPDTFTSIESYHNYYTLRLGGFHGFAGIADENGKVIIPADYYTDIRYDDNGYFVVRKGNHAGICDSAGQLLFMTKYNSLSIEKDKDGRKYLTTYLGNSKGRMSLSGDIIEEPNPTPVERLQNKGDLSYIEIRDEGNNYGVKSIEGNTIIPCQYDFIFYYEKDHTFHVRDNEFEGVIGQDGHIIIPANKYHNIVYMSAYYQVSYLDKKGIVSLDGAEIFPPIYESIHPLGNDTFEVSNGIYHGVVDASGNTIIPLRYTNIILRNGYYSVSYYEKEGLYSSDGIELVAPDYDSVFPHTIKQTGDSCFLVRNGEQCGVISTTGDIIIPVYFSNISFGVTENKSIIIAKDGLYKITYDFSGNVLSDY